MKNLFKVIRLWFKVRKAKSDLKYANCGGRIVMDMYTTQEIKTKDSIGQFMFQDACSKIDEAKAKLDTIQNQYNEL